MRRRTGLGQQHRPPAVRRLVAYFIAGLLVLAAPACSELALYRSSADDPAAPTVGPASPPVHVCGNKKILAGGPSSRPRGAVAIPPGEDSGIAGGWTIRPDTTYWFAPGTHTLGISQYAQIIPADGDVFIGAPGAILDGQGHNRYAFTGTASNVTIKYLTIQDFGSGSSATTPSGANSGQGVVNNSSGRGWIMKYLTVRYNAGAGVFVGTDNVLSYSCLRDNGEYGFQGIGHSSGQFGATHLTVAYNEVVGNNTWNWESRHPGCGCSGGDKFWDVADVSLTHNYIHNNHGPGIWADTNNADFDVEGNYVSNNDDDAIIYEISYNLRLVNNTFVRNDLVGGPASRGFPQPAVYISESGGDRRVPDSYGADIYISDNMFFDNWGGVVLYENPDRYCSSAANASTGYCTLVDPSIATISNCANPSLNRTQPYYGDCRWKTQNVRVSGNDFIFDPTDIGPKCTKANFCGFNGIFSLQGSVEPYTGSTVETHITFDQNNHFTSNTYSGPWRFMVLYQGNVVSWAVWRGRPYGQDKGSTMNQRDLSAQLSFSLYEIRNRQWTGAVVRPSVARRPCW